MKRNLHSTGAHPQSFYDMGKQDTDSINSAYPFKDGGNAADSEDTGESSRKTNEEANEKTFKSSWLRKLQVLVHELHEYERKEAVKEAAKEAAKVGLCKKPPNRSATVRSAPIRCLSK
ncbi:hypothetical protein U1Q18_017698 [Sarracenia purpurea var. burkii]